MSLKQAHTNVWASLLFEAYFAEGRLMREVSWQTTFIPRYVITATLRGEGLGLLQHLASHTWIKLEAR